MRHLHLVPAVLVLLGMTLLAPGCSTSAPGDNGDGGGDLSANGDGGATGDGSMRGAPDIRLPDPFPMYCGLDGGMFTPPKPPGGTVDCPDDKNLEGCPCPTVGAPASCWPGLRANRGLGICMDGMTTCVAGEVTNTWGPCVGAVLPTPGATGKAACNCFSGGRWAIKNLVPCFYAFGAGNMNYGSGGTTSSTLLGNGMTMCQDFGAGPVMPPSSDWSTDTVTVDCEGHFKLCYALKAGKGSDPKPTDCSIGEICTEGDYTQVNMVQTFPPLKAFAFDNPTANACAVQFVQGGGYGEMRVDGLSVTCDKVQKIFNRVTYCPLNCKTGDTRPECMNCMSGGAGNF